MTFGPGERALSDWLERNARLAWLACDGPWLVEEQLIRSVSLPLNLDQNRHHGFHSELSQKRRAVKARARELPVSLGNSPELILRPASLEKASNLRGATVYLPNIGYMNWAMSDRKLVVKEKLRGCGYGSLMALCLTAIVIIGLWPRDRSLRTGGKSGSNPTAPSTALPKPTPERAPAAKHTQTPEDKPEEAYWPSKVTASDEIVLNRITQYGAISVRRAPGSVVNVLNLESDLLQVESDGFSGEVKVDKTDFWEQAIETRNLAMERLKRDEELKKAREEKETTE